MLDSQRQLFSLQQWNQSGEYIFNSKWGRCIVVQEHIKTSITEITKINCHRHFAKNYFTGNERDFWSRLVMSHYMLLCHQEAKYILMKHEISWRFWICTFVLLFLSQPSVNLLYLWLKAGLKWSCFSLKSHLFFSVILWGRWPMHANTQTHLSTWANMIRWI